MGALSDQYGRRPFMIAGPIFGGLAVQLIGWPGLVIAMAAGRVLEGFSTASSAPSTLSFLSAATSSEPALRARAMSWYQIATVGGITGGFIIAGLIWQALQQMAFLVVTAIYVLSLVGFAQVRDTPGPAEDGDSLVHPNPLAHFALLGQHPRLLRFAPAWLLVNTILGAWLIQSTLQLTGEPRAGQHLAGALSGAGLSAAFAFFGIAFLAGIYVWGIVMNKWSKMLVMEITISGIFVSALALALMNHTAGGGNRLFLLGVLFALGVVIASGFTPAALAYLADLSEDVAQARGAVMGLYSVMLGLGQVIGAALGGPFAEGIDVLGLSLPGGVDGLLILTFLLAIAALGAVGIMWRFEGLKTPLPPTPSPARGGGE
jgi:MFS family permease